MRSITELGRTTTNCFRTNAGSFIDVTAWMDLNWIWVYEHSGCVLYDVRNLAVCECAVLVCTLYRRANAIKV
jgi:hypothetical protein